MLSSNTLPHIYSESCPSSPKIPFKHNDYPMFPIYEQKQMKRIYQSKNITAKDKLPSSKQKINKIQTKKQDHSHMKKRIGRSTDIGYQINNKFLNPRPIPKDHINNTFYFNHMKKPQNPQKVQKNLNERQTIKSKPQILRKYKYSFNVPNQNSEEQSFLPSPAFHSIKKEKKTEPKQETIKEQTIKQKTIEKHQQKISALDYDKQETQQIESESFVPLNLPACDAKSVLDHIYEQGIFRNEDLKILKLRMIHTYGNAKVKPFWKLVMKLLNKQ